MKSYQTQQTRRVLKSVAGPAEIVSTGDIENVVEFSLTELAIFFANNGVDQEAVNSLLERPLYVSFEPAQLQPGDTTVRVTWLMVPKTEKSDDS